MLVHPQFDPVAVQLGRSPCAGTGSCTWSAFVLFVVLGKMRARQNLLTGWHPRDVDDMLFYGVFGVILGGRLGYVLFYKPLYYLAHPLEILAGLAGRHEFPRRLPRRAGRAVVFARSAAQALAGRDRLRRAAGAARARGRAARQLHQRRALGRRSERAMGSAVPQAADEDKAWMASCAASTRTRSLGVYERTGMLPRHPSQLYEVGLEGLLLFVAAVDLRAPPATAGRGIGPVPGRLRHVSVSPSNSRASPTTSWAVSRSDCRWASGCRCR